MNKDKIVKNSIYGIISFQSILLGIFFIIQVCRLYFGHKSESIIYTRELTIKALTEILVLIIIWVLVVIVGIVYGFIKHTSDTTINKRSNKSKLEQLLKLLPNDIDASNEEYKLLLLEKKKRLIAWLIFTAIALISALFVFLYLFNFEHFVSNGIPNKQIVKMAYNTLPWIIIAFIAGIIATIYEEYSAKRSIEYVKVLLKTNKKTAKEVTDKKKKTIILWSIRGAILVLAITLIIVGYVDGGATGVFYKAAKICSECIGLG